jgi:hypothetical protein
MSRPYVPRQLRLKVAEQARNRCGYCLTPESIVGEPMNIEHIIPVSAGGATEEDNLWLACWLCNLHKGDRHTAQDLLTSAMTPLFNPRHEEWDEHFDWADEGVIIVGLTPTGRATLAALKLNRESLVASRRLWVSLGLHPPKD